MMIEDVKKLFKTDGKGDTHCFSLVCWTDGMWSVEITDSWQKWVDKKVPKLGYRYPSPVLLRYRWGAVFFRFVANRLASLFSDYSSFSQKSLSPRLGGFSFGI